MENQELFDFFTKKFDDLNKRFDNFEKIGIQKIVSDAIDKKEFLMVLDTSEMTKELDGMKQATKDQDKSQEIMKMIQTETAKALSKIDTQNKVSSVIQAQFGAIDRSLRKFIVDKVAELDIVEQKRVQYMMNQMGVMFKKAVKEVDENSNDPSKMADIINGIVQQLTPTNEII